MVVVEQSELGRGRSQQLLRLVVEYDVLQAGEADLGPQRAEQGHQLGLVVEVDVLQVGGAELGPQPAGQGNQLGRPAVYDAEIHSVLFFF